jgi:hypothetical protein
MVGNRATTIYGLEAGACSAEEFFPTVPMCWLSGTAQGINWQMLKKQQDILSFLSNPFFL